MNRIILTGRLTKNPEVRYTANQKVVCSFILAVDRPFVNQQGLRETDFIPVVLWGKTAELVGNSCAKGHRLCVEGRVQVRTYENKDKRTVWITEAIGDRIEFLERKSEIAASSEAQMQTAISDMGKEVPFDEEVPF